MKKDDRYIPALGLDRLTPLYDPLLRWVVREETFKRRIIEQAHIRPGYRVLDLGCGTATLTILIKQAQPGSDVIGIDGDTKVLDIGRAKAARAGVNITLDHGMAFQLPYPDGSFDRVLSSLMFHHLTTEDKRRTLSEVMRVLRPGGELHVFDFGKPHNMYTRLISRLILRFERAEDNVRGLLPEMIRQMGFERVEETARYTTFFGALALYRAQRPE